MHWYGTFSLTAEGKIGELKKLPKMARAYEEVIKLCRKTPAFRHGECQGNLPQ